jgi:hypothetical protein
MVKQGVGAFTVLPDQVLSAHRARIIRLAAQTACLACTNARNRSSKEA